MFLCVHHDDRECNYNKDSNFSRYFPVSTSKQTLETQSF